MALHILDWYLSSKNFYDHNFYLVVMSAIHCRLAHISISVVLILNFVQLSNAFATIPLYAHFPLCLLMFAN